MDNKTCLTCKHEPEWNRGNAGTCKLVPEFLSSNLIRKSEDSCYYMKEEKRSNGHGESRFMVEIDIADCDKWQQKPAK